MKIAKNFSSPTDVRLTITPDTKELESLKKHVLSHFKDQVRVPGFRPGTAPAAMLEKNVDPSTLQNEFLEHAINQFYGKAVEVEKLRPLGQPQIKITKFVPFTDLEFEVEASVLGEIKLPDYKKIKVAKKAVKITAKEVDDVIATLRQRMAERKPVDRPAKNGDELSIDFDGYDKDGKAVAGASAKSYPLLIGSNSFIPGFEDKLVGVKTGDEPEIKLTFPADYGVANLANQKIDFKVKVHKVNELIEPALDESFAQKTGPFKSVADLKADIKKQLTAEREAQNAREFENELVAKITAQSKVDVPKALVESEISRLEAEEKQNLAYRGQTWEEHLKEEGISEDEHRERQRPQATERVKGGLVLSEIAEREEVQVSNEEVEERLQMLKGQYKDVQMRTELDKPENRNEIVSRLLTEKTLAKLVKYASK